MSALRRYIVAIVAVAVAFAGGVALGGGPLQGEEPLDRSAELTSQNAALGDEVEALEQGQVVDEAVAQQTLGNLVQGRLASTSVAVVALPGVPQAWVDRTHESVTAAGGQVTVTLDVSDKLLDPGQKSYVQSVADNSLSSVDGVAAGPDAYDTIGRLAARAYATSEPQSPVDDTVTRIDGQLTGAGLVTVDQEPRTRAGLTVVLDAGETGTATGEEARRTIAAHFVDGLTSADGGTLLVGPHGSAEPTGLFEALSSDTTGRVTTFDQATAAVAPVVTVLSLVEVREGTTGRAYGMVDGDVVLPSGLGG